MDGAAEKKKPGRRKKASTGAAQATDPSANLICDGTSKKNPGPKKKASIEVNKRKTNIDKTSKFGQCRPVDDALARAIAFQRDDVSPVAKMVFEKSLLHLYAQRDEVTEEESFFVF
jgi:hypothetical protein